MLRKPPRNLGKLIRIVNSVPPSSDVSPWKDWPETIKAVVEVFPNEADQLAEMRKRWIQAYNRYPKIPRAVLATLKQLIPALVECHPLDVSRRALEFLHIAREALRRVARMNKGGAAPPAVDMTFPVSFSTMIGTGMDGRIVVSLGPILESLQDVEAARIGQCPVCGKIFWAGRIDKPYCSVACGQVYRKRLTRSNYQELYKPKRLDRYYRKRGR